MSSFIEKLDPDALAFFNEVASKPFNQQAVAFLNAYWPEVGSQAEFVFTYAAAATAAATSSRPPPHRHRLSAAATATGLGASSSLAVSH